MTRPALALLCGAAITAVATGQTRPRARDLGVQFEGQPGPGNAITDVAGVRVGHTTLVRGEGLLRPGHGPVRTGVTVVFPRPDAADPVFAGWFALNGNGEMTGAHWIAEAGWLACPITITNTFSVGLAHHATLRWMANRFPEAFAKGELWLLPVAAETFDGHLNDIAGFHVTESHVRAAIDSARSGAVAEGCVGGGTGMICYEFKGGTGTASRRVTCDDGSEHSVGVLVQANHGIRPWLRIAGRDCSNVDLGGNRVYGRETGSIIVIIATDAPLAPIQLERLARRASLGIARGGTPGGNSSGDLFLAFSTANGFGSLPEPARQSLAFLGGEMLDSLFMGVVEAVEEAVLNAMVAAETMTGYRGRTVAAIDTEKVRKLFGGA
jgi:L-aminopeptidase/D-esterase-like protein